MLLLSVKEIVISIKMKSVMIHMLKNHNCEGRLSHYLGI